MLFDMILILYKHIKRIGMALNEFYEIILNGFGRICIRILVL